MTIINIFPLSGCKKTKPKSYKETSTLVTPSTKIGLDILEALTLDVQTASLVLAHANNFFELQPFEVFGVTTLLKLSFSFSRLFNPIKFLHIRIPLEKWHLEKKKIIEKLDFYAEFCLLEVSMSCKTVHVFFKFARFGKMFGKTFHNFK